MYNNYTVLYASCLPAFGGLYGYGASAGAFCLIVDSSAADSGAALGGRLMHL